MNGKLSIFLVVLLALGTALVLTNRWFPAVDDECAVIDRAAQPVSYTLHLYLTGKGEHEHPPLYDLILHGWLRLTNGRVWLLRVPAIVFYLLGIWILADATGCVGGDRAATWSLVLTALWPFGFHFGRVAAWYSFCFFLVSLLSWAYLRYLERRSLTSWTWVALSALALVYSNYFGWAILALLAFDLLVRGPLVREWKRVCGAALVLLIAYAPIVNAFRGELRNGIHSAHSPLGIALIGIYNLYCLFVSESVAPWFWTLGIAAGVAVGICLIVILFCAPWPARRFALYFGVLLGLMTILGIVETKRLLFIAPWLILSLAVTLSHLPKSSARRRAFSLCLVVIGSIGWYGVFARNLYAAPHWVEPWDEVAQEAASVARTGGIVIGNNASFFFYLTYMLPERTNSQEAPQFRGLLPSSTRRQGVYDPQQWLAEGEPLGPTVFLVKGLHYGVPEGPTDATERYLDSHCSLISSKNEVYDRGATWKERFAPEAGQIPWRIQLRSYACPSAE